MLTKKQLISLDYLQVTIIGEIMTHKNIHVEAKRNSKNRQIRGILEAF